MVVIIRRVLSASVEVEGSVVGEIQQGLLLYVGLSMGDTKDQCRYSAKKIANLRIFDNPDPNGKEISVKDIQGRVLSVSQFTLSADTAKGTRPSYTKAMPSNEARPLFEFFNSCLKEECGFDIETGVFGADMKIYSLDDGPFTIIVQTN